MSDRSHSPQPASGSPSPSEHVAITSQPTTIIASSQSDDGSDSEHQQQLRQTSPEPGSPLSAASEPENPSQNLQDELFGDDDDEEDEEQVKAPTRPNGKQKNTAKRDEDDDDDQDDAKENVRRQGRRVRQRVNSISPDPDAPRRSLSRSRSPKHRDLSGSASPRSSPYQRNANPLDEDQDDPEILRQLEYKEDDDLEPDDNIELAHLTLPQMPVRHTKEHWMARIPHFLRYVTQPFDPEAWDEEHEETMLKEEGFTTGFVHDTGAVSLLRTSNTIRWRYTNQLDKDGAKVPESNARIVKWSDGTMSLQVGRELFDITQQTEAASASATSATDTPPSGGLLASSQSQSASATTQSNLGPGPSSQTLLSQVNQSNLESMPMGAAGSSSRPNQSLTYLVVPHHREAVMEAQRPIAGSLTFTPADTRSETHMRIAKALRFQKTARVVATDAGEGARDPEVEKARIEKELKDAEKRRIRERLKQDRKSGKFDDDMFDIESRRRGGRYVGGSRKVGAGPRADYYSDESDVDDHHDNGISSTGRSKAKAEVKRNGNLSRYVEEDDGFIVDDEDENDFEEEDDGYSSKKKKKPSYDDDDPMQIDDELDEMELAEARIEEKERARKKAAQVVTAGGNQENRSKRVASDDDDDDDEDVDVDAEGEADEQPPSLPSHVADPNQTTIEDASAVKKKRIIESDDDE